MLTILVPLLVAVAGLLVYVVASNAKVAEVGRLLFACGSLVATFGAAHTILRL